MVFVYLQVNQSEKMRKATRTPCAMPVQQINVNPVEYSKDVEHSMDEGSEWRVSSYSY